MNKLLLGSVAVLAIGGVWMQTGRAQVTVTWTQEVAGAHAWADAANWDLRVPGTGGGDTDVATFPVAMNGQTVAYDTPGPRFRQILLQTTNGTLIINAALTNTVGLATSVDNADRNRNLAFGSQSRYVSSPAYDAGGNVTLSRTRMRVESGGYAHWLAATYNQKVTLSYSSLTNRGTFVLGYGNYDWYRINNSLTLASAQAVATDGGLFDLARLELTGTGAALLVTQGATAICRYGMLLGGSTPAEYATSVDLADGTITNRRGRLIVASPNEFGATYKGRGTVTIHSGRFEQGGATIIGVGRVGTLAVHGGSFSTPGDVYVGGGLNVLNKPKPIAPVEARGLLHVTGGAFTMTNAPVAGSATVYTVSYFYLFLQANHTIHSGHRVVLTDVHPDLLGLWQTGRTYYAYEGRTSSHFSLAPSLEALAIDSGSGNKGKAIAYVTFPARLQVGNWTTFSDGTVLVPGQLVLEGGTMTLDELIATNGAASVIAFTGGTLNVKNSTVAGGAPLAVGGGATPAVLNLDGGLHTFSDGLTLAPNATLAVAGDAVGRAALAGDLTLGADSALSVTLAPDGGDRLSVTGTVTLAEGALSVAASGDAPAGSTAFVILENDGADAVSGRFGDRRVSVAWQNGVRDYLILCAGGDGNDVELWPVPPGTLFLIR